MSPRESDVKASARTSTLASQWLLENLPALSAAVVERTFASDPKLEKKYGNSGRSKCEEDAMYHLHFLSSALAVDSEKVFVDYVGWAKIVLHSRGIPVADLANTLDAMRYVLRRQAPKRLALAGKYVEAASAALPMLPEHAPTLIDSSMRHGKLANSYLNSLLVFKRDEAVASLVRELDAGLTFQDLFQYVLSPVQKEVGRLWQEKRITVVQEHYCTAATDMLLLSYRRKFLGTRRNVTAVAVCADGEEHCLGIKMFSDILESDGWRTSYIGPKCPNADVLDYLQKNRTDLIAVSVTTPLNLVNAKRLIAAIKALPSSHVPAVLVGGSVLNSEPDLWKRMGADGWGATVLEGLDVANRLVGEQN
jgi:MerR family transcriptional regulator, light-induced transcriptional regulator